MKTLLLAISLLICLATVRPAAAEPITTSLIAESGPWSETVVEGIDPAAESFVLEMWIDPVEAEGGDVQVVAGLVIGLENSKGSVAEPVGSIRLHLREGVDRARYDLWHRKDQLSYLTPNPKPPGWVDNRDYQHPNELPLRNGTGHRIKLVVWPDAGGSRLRLFVDFDDRPAEEHFLNERIRAGVAKLFAMRGGQEIQTKQTSRFKVLRIEAIVPQTAAALPPRWESVLQAVDFSHPAMRSAGEAFQQGRMEEAKALFLEHMRTRQKPTGPSLEEAESTALHPDWKKIADEVLAGRYGTVGYFSQFASQWTDTTGETHRWVLQQEPLRVNWPRCSGYLNRHFHWVSLAKAWEENHQPSYARRFSAEVLDWGTREPFYWERCPTVGGVNLMDGTVFRWGFMNTSNIGRRLELTWWPAYEVFRKSPDFSDEAHFAMLLGMVRQARLIMNPSSFAAHDDGGAHTTMALLQTALLLPEFTESAAWQATAMKRWDVMLAAQFHPDGSHVSLSTGYNWASITALENYLRLMERFGGQPPEKYLEILEKSVEHPLLLSTPSQTQIDLNDGGWSLIDDRFRETRKWFPQRTDFQWMASKGDEGAPPKQTSCYFPNAGQYILRTGWGPKEKYLFFGAGPWGASHGKMDALNIYAQFGSHLLVRNAGRGSYSGVGNTKHAGRSLSFNTLSPDWAQENSIPQWKQDMHRGFHPPHRRWITNENFEYGEGSFEYGWYGRNEHIQGKWLRQVLFVKGNEARREGYYVVLDTVEPADDKSRRWRHPWQLGLNSPNIGIRDADRSATAITEGAALQILPVGDMTVSIIQGQEAPELLGWRVYDTQAIPWPVPTYQWQANATFCRAWIIQMQAAESDWPVRSVETHPAWVPGELRFTLHRHGGGTDHVLRRFPAQQPVEFQGEMIEGDLAVLCTDEDGNLRARLELKEGETSVANASLATNVRSRTRERDLVLESLGNTKLE